MREKMIPSKVRGIFSILNSLHNGVENAVENVKNLDI